MAIFKLKSILKGYKRLFGMTAEVYNENGDLLDSVDINNAGKRINFRFDRDEALQGANNADLTIKLIDSNGDAHNFSRTAGRLYDLDSDEQTFTTTISANKKRKRVKYRPTTEQLDTRSPIFTSGPEGSVDENVDPSSLVYDAETTDTSAVSYALSGGDSNAFTIDPETGRVTINQSPDFESKSSYSFSVVATDEHGNASTQAVNVKVNDIEEGQTVQLTPLLDNISANDLSNQSDVITAELGTLGNGFLDSVVDGSTTDSDLLVIKTNGNFDLDDSLDDSEITRIQNIETIQVIADQDDAGNTDIELGNIINLKKLDVDGTFTNTLDLDEWADTGATEFDFSGITSTQGVELERADAGNQNFAGDIVFKGSAGGDVFEGLVGNVTMNGGQGNDTLVGSREGISKITGGAGTDEIDLWDHNAQHTISLARQTSQTSKDTVILDTFQGFNNDNARALNTFDLIEIDAATFTNYNAGQPVQQREDFLINANTNLSNTIVTADFEADLSQGTGFNFDNNGDGILGFAADTGTLIYSASGNFSADAQELFEIGGLEGANFVPTRQINVI